MYNTMQENNPTNGLGNKKPNARSVISAIKRRTRRLYSAEEKIQIVLEGLRGEDSISAICRKYGINENNYYVWSKEFMEAGKKRLSGDTARQATSGEVGSLKKENTQLKEIVADLLMQNTVLKKNLNGME
jgi:transposase